MRMDRDAKGYLLAADLHAFLHENGAAYTTEADCEFVLKFFDSDMDARLNYNE